MTLEAFFFSLALATAIMDWLALGYGKKRLDYLAKPGVILLLITSVSLTHFHSSTQLKFFILIGLAFSLVGDIILMLPKDRFLAGLVSFVLAYMAYAAAFTPDPPTINGWAVAAILVFGALVITLLREVLKGLDASSKSKMKIPAAIFGIVVFLMLTTGMLTLFRPNWPPTSAVAIASGAGLVFLSDSLLSYNRFVRPIPSARIKVRIPYHLGQILITAGALLVSGFPPSV